MPRKTASLRARLAGLLGLLFLGGMVALYLAATSYARLAADRSFDRLLAGSALSIAETLSVRGNKIAVDIPYAALDMLSAAPDDKVFYRVIGPEGRTVTGYGDLPRSTSVAKMPGQDLDEQPSYFDADYRGERVRFVSLDREIARPASAGTVEVQVGQTRRARDALSRELLIAALLPIMVMTVLALAVVWFGIGVALRPLTRIGAEIRQRQPEELGALETPVPSEIRPLVDALNGFMRRLAGNIEVMRNFIADAAHQLRTPLAAISAQAQLAEHEEAHELDRTLASIHRNSQRMTRLVNQLLSDATVQHRADVRRFDEFDLLRTLRQAIRETVPIAEDSDVRLTTKLQEAPFRGDPVMIGESIKNLIHNALVHGRAEEGEVALELLSTDCGYRVTVSDRGPGIPPNARERVFERFSREPGKAPGAGLGLAIVRQAIRSHGGEISLDDRPGGGLIVTMSLPESCI